MYAQYPLEKMSDIRGSSLDFVLIAAIPKNYILSII